MTLEEIREEALKLVDFMFDNKNHPRIIIDDSPPHDPNKGLREYAAKQYEAFAIRVHNEAIEDVATKMEHDAKKDPDVCRVLTSDLHGYLWDRIRLLKLPTSGSAEGDL